MKDNLEIQEAKFRSFLNKTITGASKAYYNKQMKYEQRELRIMDDENFTEYIKNYIMQEEFVPLDLFEESSVLNNAYKSLSNIEKTVIFLYFDEEYKIKEIAAILRMNEDSIGRIKKRAINKIKNSIKGVK